MASRPGSSDISNEPELPIEAQPDDEPADERGFFSETMQRVNGKKPATKPLKAEPEAHYHGHRDRLRTKFRDLGDTALADYELLELLLFRLIPRRDTKPSPRRYWIASERSPACSARPCICCRRSRESAKRWRPISSWFPPLHTAR